MILDEFDEMPPELYASGPLAEAFFSNLRTLSGRRNLAFMLVGGENMPAIVQAQGDQLNKFAREGLTYFSRTEDWADYSELVTRPTRDVVRWSQDAIGEVHSLTGGHPYYTKILCARVFDQAVVERDADITADEVRRASRQLMTTLDTNSFAHLWKDGIAGDRGEQDAIAMQRCRVLVAMGRILRTGRPATRDAIWAANLSTRLLEHHVEPILRDFCRRLIMIEEDGVYGVALPLFRDWLSQTGVHALLDHHLKDDLAVASQRAEDSAYVQDHEIASLVENWPLYRGTVVSMADVRQWLAQVASYAEQRMLFKLVKNLRFFSEREIRDKLRLSHSMVKDLMPSFGRRSALDRRRDLIVTYVDGPGKSGHYYASRYAEENSLIAACVVELSAFESQLAMYEASQNISVNGVVIVDDLVGTGRSLAVNVQRFIDSNRDSLIARSATVVAVALCGTEEGQLFVEEALRAETAVKIEFKVCEPLAPANYAFRVPNAIWSTATEEAAAKDLCEQLGAVVSPGTPLGFAGQGLLLTFPTGCPNNSLPILHAGDPVRWKPLFKRTLH